MEIEIVANNEFRTSTFEQGKKFDGNYLKGFFVESIYQESEKETFVANQNPRIRTLETRIKSLKSEEADMERDFQQQKLILKSLKSDLELATEIYEKEKLMEDIKDQEKKMDVVFENGSKVQDLKVQIRELRESDRIKNKEKRLQVERKNREGEEEPTRFSGVVKYLSILF